MDNIAFYKQYDDAEEGETCFIEFTYFDSAIIGKTIFSTDMNEGKFIALNTSLSDSFAYIAKSFFIQDFFCYAIPKGDDVYKACLFGTKKRC